jgi:hypothetical protein
MGISQKDQSRPEKESVCRQFSENCLQAFLKKTSAGVSQKNLCRHFSENLCRPFSENCLQAFLRKISSGISQKTSAGIKKINCLQA